MCMVIHHPPIWQDKFILMSKHWQDTQATFCKEEQRVMESPTKAAMKVHVKQAAYQGGHIRGQICAPCISATTGNQLGVDQKSKETIWAPAE
jgi:hypothetical protein